MVNELIKNNADVLTRELQWFSDVVDTRLNLYFGKESDYPSIFNVTPQVHPEVDAPYVRFIDHYKMNLAERIVLMLALVPHIMPQLLDKLFEINTDYNK